MEPAGQSQQQRLPANHQPQRRGGAQWQPANQNRNRQPNQPQYQNQSQPQNTSQPQIENQPRNQPQNQSHRPHYNRGSRRRDPRERFQGVFAGQLSQPGSSQSSDSERSHKVGVEQPGAKESLNPRAESSLSLEQKLQEYTQQRDKLNQSIEQLHAELAGRAEVARLEKQLEQVQAQLANEQKHRKELEAAYQESQDAQQKLQAEARETDAQFQTAHAQLRERDAHIQELGEQLNHKEQQLRDSQEQSNQAAWRNDNVLRDQENQIRVLRKEKEDAIAEGSARHQMIERQTGSITSLERQLQDSARKLEEKDEQIQQHQEAVWAKEEQLREAESNWKGQEAFHINAGRQLDAQAKGLWHENQHLRKQLEDLKHFFDEKVHTLEKQLAERQSAKPGPVLKGSSIGLPPGGSAGVKGQVDSNGGSQVLPPGDPSAILAPPLSQGSRTIQPASKPQTSQPAQPANPQPPGQHQQGLLRQAVEPQPTNTPPQPPAKVPPPQFPRQAEPFRPAEPKLQQAPVLSQNPKPQQESAQARGALLDEATLVSTFVELISGKEEDAWAINSTLANKLGAKLAPNHWKNYKPKHGSLREFLVAHPEAFRLTPDDKVYLTPEAQQKRGAASTGPSDREPASSSPTPQEASRVIAQNVPRGGGIDTKGSLGTAVAVTPLAAQKQKQRPQQGGANGRPAEPSATTNGKGKPNRNVSGGRNPRASSTSSSVGSNGGSTSEGPHDGKRSAEGQRTPNGSNLYSHPNANGGLAQPASNSRQTGAKGAGSDPLHSQDSLRPKEFKRTSDGK